MRQWAIIAALEVAMDMLKIKTGRDAERELPYTQQTMRYIQKLSYAATVKVTYPSGEWLEMECSIIVQRGNIPWATV